MLTEWTQHLREVCAGQAASLAPVVWTLGGLPAFPLSAVLVVFRQ